MTKDSVPGARRVVPRSRGAVSGLALIVLGVWGALIPFVGPYFNFFFTPDDAWHWTTARGWLEVLPGAAAFLAGFLLLTSRSRSMTLVAAWLGIAAGAWFVVGLQLQSVWHIGSPGQPAGSGSGIRVLEALAMFTLLGVVIVYFAATAFGRLSVVSARDQRAAEQRESEAEALREREAAATQDRESAAVREREAYATQQREAGASQERDETASRERDEAAARERNALAARDRTDTDTRTEQRGSRDHRALNTETVDRQDAPAGQGYDQPAQNYRPAPTDQQQNFQQAPSDQQAQNYRPAPNDQQHYQQAPTDQRVQHDQQAQNYQPAQGYAQQPGPQHAAGPQGYGQQGQTDGASAAGGQPAGQPKQGWLQRVLHRN